jgi:hypothetical protein
MPIGAFGIELPTDRVRVDTPGHLRALACLEDGLLHAGSRPGSSILLRSTKLQRLTALGWALSFLRAPRHAGLRPILRVSRNFRSGCEG